MNGERLFRILGWVDEDLIEEADTASSPAASRRRPRWGRAVLAGSACAAALWAAVVMLPHLSNLSGATGNSSGSTAAAGESAAGADGANGGAAAEAAGFDSYAGPVFSLLTTEEMPLTAERTVTWSFPSASSSTTQVQDTYLIHNDSDTACTVTAYYPFSASLDTLSRFSPAVTLDGQPADTALAMGDYAGTYTGVWRDNGVDNSTWNLAPPREWTDYADLLADETYWTAALTERVSLDIPVTVYRFSDSPAPEGQRAATRAVTVTPGADTTILTYGFNGYGESDGLPQYSYFLRENRAVSPMLIVLGTDLQDYALAGYTDGGCEEKLELGPCTITRTETTLEAVLQELCRSILDQQDGTGRQGLEDLDPALYQDAAVRLLTSQGPLSDTPADRYSENRLDDLLQEVLSMDRLFFHTFSITVPAGGSVEVSCSMEKAASFNFYESDSSNTLGFDFLTGPTGGLSLTTLTTVLEQLDTASILDQNLGFDSGLTQVALDPAQPHYYLTLDAFAS